METEAQKRATKKYRDKHFKSLSLAVRKDFFQQINDFMDSEQGRRYESRSKFIQQAIREKMEAEGYHFDD